MYTMYHPNAAFANIAYADFSPSGLLKVKCGMKGHAFLTCLWQRELTLFFSVFFFFSSVSM